MISPEKLFQLRFFLSCLLCLVEKLLDEKAGVNFKIYDAMYWEINNYKISRSKSNQKMKFCQLIKYDVRTFLQKSCRK